MSGAHLISAVALSALSHLVASNQAESLFGYLFYYGACSLVASTITAVALLTLLSLPITAAAVASLVAEMCIVNLGCLTGLYLLKRIPNYNKSEKDDNKPNSETGPTLETNNQNASKGEDDAVAKEQSGVMNSVPAADNEKKVAQAKTNLIEALGSQSTTLQKAVAEAQQKAKTKTGNKGEFDHLLKTFDSVREKQKDALEAAEKTNNKKISQEVKDLSKAIDLQGAALKAAIGNANKGEFALVEEHLLDAISVQEHALAEMKTASKVEELRDELDKVISDFNQKVEGALSEARQTIKGQLEEDAKIKMGKNARKKSEKRFVEGVVKSVKEKVDSFKGDADTSFSEISAQYKCLDGDLKSTLDEKQRILIEEYKRVETQEQIEKLLQSKSTDT